MYKKFLTLSILIFSQYAYANICHQFAGAWTGTWENLHRKILPARIVVSQSDQKFQGVFTLADGSKGNITGTCIIITPDEAYLTFEKEPPFYNSCRGVIIQDSKVRAHIFCFNPDESGYFIKT